MHKHLFRTAAACPATKNRIELTDEIKQHIINNRVYIPLEDKTTKMIQNINMINNFLVNMDPVVKLDQVLDYEHKRLIGFGDHVEDKHQTKLKRLQDDEYKYVFKIEHEDIMDMIDHSTQIKQGIETMNVLYSDKLNRVMMFHDDEWNEYRTERGIQQIVRVYQTYFFDYYEKFVLRRLFQNPNINAYVRNEYGILLKQYYKYLAIFGLDPFAKDRENEEIVSSGPYLNHSNPRFIEEFALNIYKEAKSGIKKAEIKDYKKTLTDIVKRNTCANMKILNDEITSLFNIDEAFKTMFLEKNNLK